MSSDRTLGSIPETIPYSDEPVLSHHDSVHSEPDDREDTESLTSTIPEQYERNFVCDYQPSLNSPELWDVMYSELSELPQVTS